MHISIRASPTRHGKHVECHCRQHQVQRGEDDDQLVKVPDFGEVRFFVGDHEEREKGDRVENLDGGVVAHPRDVTRVRGVRVVIVVRLKGNFVHRVCNCQWSQILMIQWSRRDHG